jgi:Holliday junction resolvase-like predicted endonuclease
MGKTRVGVRLKEKVGGKKSYNKSEDLARLTEKYNVFCKRLEGLVAVRRSVNCCIGEIEVAGRSTHFFVFVSVIATGFEGSTYGNSVTSKIEISGKSKKVIYEQHCFTHSHQLPLHFQVAQHLAVLSKDTVLFEQTGQMPGADRSSDSVLSYLSVQEGVANKSKMYASKYSQFVVSYAEEWYKVVSKRVGEGIKKAEELRVELDHYQSKVEGKSYAFW